MLKLTLKDLEKVYNKVKGLVYKSYYQNNFDNLVKYTDLLCFCVFRFNWIYTDRAIEDLLSKVSQDNFRYSVNSENLEKNRIVFYDQIGSIDCLGLQYLRGLISAKYEIMYIFESSTRKCSNILLDEINNYDKARIICIDSSKSNKIKLIEDIRNQIVSFRPSKALLHSPAEGTFGVILWNSLVGIKRIRIVPGDHHFYLGVNCADYFIEFRKFGYTTAVQKRGIDKSRIFMLPYYPILSNTDFYGFEKDLNNKIIIFSAGAAYKIYGENDLYFDILKRIIEKYSNVVVLFAGDGYLNSFRDFIKRNGFQNRIFLLGYRKDLNMCVANSDIYLTTFPITGGLTTQYAAYHSKPVLSFTTPNLSVNYIEDIIGVDRCIVDPKITYTNFEEFLIYADNLIINSEYRMSEGMRVHNLLSTVENFNKGLEVILNGKAKPIEIEFEEIDYNKIVEQNIVVENKYIPFLKTDLLLLLRWRILLLGSKFIINSFLSHRYYNFLIKLLYLKFNIKISKLF